MSCSVKALVVEEVRCAHVAPADVGVAVTVDGVCAGLGDNVQDNAAGLAIFGVVVIRDDLEFFYLFHGSAERVARRSRNIRDVSTIDVVDDTSAINTSGSNDFTAEARIVGTHARR